MADNVENAAAPEPAAVREAVCVHTMKIFDSCKDRDCHNDLRVYLTETSQEAVNGAAGVRAKGAELLYVDAHVEPVQFNRGFYSVDLSYYYKVSGETTGAGAGTAITGLAYCTKRVLLYGSEGGAKVFSSDAPIAEAEAIDVTSLKMPKAVVEAVDPLLLELRLIETQDGGADTAVFAVPEAIADAFDSPLVLTDEARKVYTTLGQFTLVRLERDTQLLIPAYDYCVPGKDCADSDPDDPCTLFSRIDFPVDVFFPPDTISGFSETYRGAIEELKG